MSWSVNECTSLHLCEGRCVVLVGSGGVCVKDRWSLSGVVPPLLLFFLFFFDPASLPCHLSKNLTSSISCPLLTPPTLVPPPSSQWNVKLGSSLTSSLFCLSQVSSASLSSFFCWWGILCVCVIVCVIAILVPADVTRRALKLVICEGKPETDAGRVRLWIHFSSQTFLAAVCRLFLLFQVTQVIIF